MSNILLAILKTYWSKNSGQIGTNRKQESSGSEPIGITRAAEKCSRYISNYSISPICFHLYCMGNGNDDISSEEPFERNKKNICGYF
jgi:hypothetical protein